MVDTDLATLRAALDDVPESAWSQPSTFEQTEVHHGYRQVSLVTNGGRKQYAELFATVLDAFAPVHSAWLSWIEPGGFILPHRDAGPWRERWQVPIRTSGEMNGITATEGAPFRVEHWKRHSVTNDGDSPRIHLVIDRDVIVDATVSPFTVYREEA